VGGFWRGVSHLRRPESFLGLIFYRPLRIGLTSAAPAGLVRSLGDGFAGASRWMRLWCGRLGKSGGRATALQKFLAVEGWAGWRSFVASLLCMTAKGGLGGWTAGLGEAERLGVGIE
jgi:hypothetical protein